MATVFGVLALVLGLIGPWVAGWICVALAAVFGGLAIFFQIRKNRQMGEEGPKKKGGMICGIIGIVLCFIGQFTVMGMADKIKEQAQKMGDEASYVLSGIDGMKSTGIIGFIVKAMDAKPADMTDEEYSKQLTDQLKKVTDSITAK